ncbi:hypothetical protein ATN06_15955 [Bacillus thuringiensis]|nr:hypothetical protein ATN06_15955 [Bacillus thuringiensis]
MYVTLLLLHVKMMKSSFWGKNVLKFGLVNGIMLMNFDSSTVHEIYINDFSNISFIT